MAKRSGKALEKVLLDAWASQREAAGWRVDASELGVGDAQSPYWSVSFDTLHAGRQEGVDVVEVDNGRLVFTIVPTRGMSIAEADLEGIRLGWESPVGELVHPSFVDLESRGGLGFLDGFSEWFVRCGLSSNGAPYPGGTLHGRIANTPASWLGVRVELEPPHTIAIRGLVRESCVFFGHLILETEILTEPGANWIRIRDRVVNRAASPATMQMLYHVNYGRPLLEAGARLCAPVEAVSPLPASTPPARVRSWDRYGGPRPGAAEEVYAARLRADRKGRTLQMLRSSAGDLGVVQRYALRDLPCFTLWKMEGAWEDIYVTGLEPGTNWPNPKPFEEAQRRVVRLGGGRSWGAELTVEILEGRKAVAAVEREAKAIQGRRKPLLLTAPAKGVSAAAKA